MKLGESIEYAAISFALGCRHEERQPRKCTAHASRRLDILRNKSSKASKNNHVEPVNVYAMTDDVCCNDASRSGARITFRRVRFEFFHRRDHLPNVNATIEHVHNQLAVAWRKLL